MLTETLHQIFVLCCIVFYSMSPDRTALIVSEQVVEWKNLHTLEANYLVYGLFHLWVLNYVHFYSAMETELRVKIISRGVYLLYITWLFFSLK